MTYIVYKRFKENGIGGQFNLPYGTLLTEKDGFIFAPDGRPVCAVTSENGWNYFHPNTKEGAYRQAMLNRLYKYYSPGGIKPAKGDAAKDFDPAKWPGAKNTYWKNLLRTMPTDKLEQFYRERLGEPKF